MKTIHFLSLVLLFVLFSEISACGQSQTLKLVFIRHGEKPDDGDNLNCQGLNRSMLLPAVLNKKFGKPANIYIPALTLGGATKHTRMLQTVSPFAVKYNLRLNSAYDVDDAKGIARALIAERGTILIVWEHQSLPPILQYLGIAGSQLKWPSNDFDSIWIVTFRKGRAILVKDKENLNPGAGCPF